MSLISAAVVFVQVAREDGCADQMPDGFELLAEEVDNLARIDALIGHDGVLCPRCQQREAMPMPMPISAMMYWVQYHAEKHRHCPATQSQNETRKTNGTPQ